MKKLTVTYIQRLEQKMNLLNDKLDKIMEVQGIKLEKAPEQIDKEEEKKRKARERQQAKILQKQNFKIELERILENHRLQQTTGRSLQKEFNLVTIPSADRIREYQRTKDPKAFNGLKRKD